MTDMTKGNVAKVLSTFAIPLIFGALFQQLYQIVDLIIVGRYEGTSALASIGNTTYISMFFMAIITGLSAGITVVAARHIGEGDYDKFFSCAWTSFTGILMLSVLITVFGLVLNRYIFIWIKTPVEIRPLSEIYFSRYLCGLIFLYLFNVCSALFQSIGDSKSSLLIMILSTGINILLDFFLVAYLNRGVCGAGEATAIAEFISCVVGLGLLKHKTKKIKASEKKIRYSRNEMSEILKIGVPSALQMSVVSIANLLLQPLINQFGTVVVAALTAAMKIDNFARTPMGAVSNAVSAFTAQNIGANQKSRMGKGLQAAILLDVAISAVVAILIFTFGNQMIGLFVKDSNVEEVIRIGKEYLMILAVFFIFQGVMNTMNGVFRGIKDSKAFFWSMSINMFVRVGVSYLAVYAFGLGYKGVWMATPVGWIIGFIVNLFYYRRDKACDWEIDKIRNKYIFSQT